MIERLAHAIALPERFQTALHYSPFAEHIVQGDRWTDGYARVVDRMTTACREHACCAHDTAHLVHVADNAFLLADIYQKRTGILIDDSAIALLVCAHDIGYGLKRVQWRGSTAINHAEYGMRVARRYATIFVASDTSMPTISPFTTEECVKVLSECSANTPITPEVMVPIMVKLADCFDYFRADRLHGIAPPTSYEENPYYFLAQAVSSYTLRMDSSCTTLSYRPQLREGAPGHWHDACRQQFGDVWKLADLVSSRLEMQFFLIGE